MFLTIPPPTKSNTHLATKLSLPNSLKPCQVAKHNEERHGSATKHHSHTYRLRKNSFKRWGFLTRLLGMENLSEQHHIYVPKKPRKISLAIKPPKSIKLKSRVFFCQLMALVVDKVLNNLPETNSKKSENWFRWKAMIWNRSWGLFFRPYFQWLFFLLLSFRDLVNSLHDMSFGRKSQLPPGLI